MLLGRMGLNGQNTYTNLVFSTEKKLKILFKPEQFQSTTQISPTAVTATSSIASRQGTT